MYAPLFKQVQVAEQEGRVTHYARHDRAAGRGHPFRVITDVPLNASNEDVRVHCIEYGERGNVGSAYRRHLLTLSLILHPWRIFASTPQTSEEVACQLKGEIDAIEVCIDTHGLPVKQKALDKVRTQLAGLSALVDLWWQGVWDDVQHVTLTPMWTSWAEEVLLPLMYWQEQLSRTRCPRRKARILQALEAVQAACDRHPITGQLAPDVLESWQAWAAAQAKAFQRASSAVEGRNGSLSGMHHNHRGLPKGALLNASVTSMFPAYPVSQALRTHVPYPLGRPSTRSAIMLR